MLSHWVETPRNRYMFPKLKGAGHNYSGGRAGSSSSPLLAFGLPLNLTSMVFPMFLEEDEIIQLSGRRRRNAQASALSFMGIEYKMRPDGSLAVLRSHVEKLFGERIQPRNARKAQPRFDLVT